MQLALDTVHVSFYLAEFKNFKNKAVSKLAALKKGCTDYTLLQIPFIKLYFSPYVVALSLKSEKYLPQLTN